MSLCPYVEKYVIMLICLCSYVNVSFLCGGYVPVLMCLVKEIMCSCVNVSGKRK